MTTLFCNLLENALDATKNMTDPFIELSVTAHGSNEFIISMINSCQKNPFSKQGSHLISRKMNQRRHGYGMISIQHVIDKYDGNSQLYYDAQDSTFHTIIILKWTKTDQSFFR